MPTKIKRSQQLSISYEEIINLYQQRIAQLEDDNIKLLAQNQVYARVIDDENNDINLNSNPNQQVQEVDMNNAKVTKL